MYESYAERLLVVAVAELLSEARSCYKLRDERVNYADASADGITRLAFIEIAQRLQKR